MNIQDSSRRVVVTGMGVVSALGLTLEDLWQACRDGRSGVRPTKADEPYPVTCVASVDDFTGKIQDFGDLDDAKKKAIRKGIKLMAREIQLGVAAAQRALCDAKLGDAIPSRRVGVSFASDYVVTTPQELIEAIAACRKRVDDGSEDFDGEHWRENGMSKMTPLWQLKYLTNMSASHITIYNEFYGPAFDVTNREASFTTALSEAVETIRSGRADAMLVGATGSRVHPLRLIEAIKNGEVSREIVKEYGATEPGVARPFDANRSGAIPGEGSGAILIEAADVAQARGAKIYAEICGGTYRAVLKHARDVDASEIVGTCEAPFDLAQTVDASRESIRLALRRLMEKYDVQPEEIGHINANARGDVSLDLAEAAALRDVLGDRLDSIPATSLKGHLGNPGAGAGAIETIAGVLAFQNDALFPTLNYETPDPNCALNVVREYGVAPGDSFIKVCAQGLGQASVVLARRWNG